MEGHVSTDSLGQLVRVDLRQVWENEAGDFTPWLARPENIALLGETLGLELDVESTEADVGPYRADIVCRDMGGGSQDGELVLVENQLGRTDHTHLGQLLTYAAGLDAVKVVWIAAPFTDEHRSALDWLNERTDRNVNFFGLEVELWRIGESPTAPKFNVVAKPNDWNTTVRESASQDRKVSEGKRQQYAFWCEFVELVEEQGGAINCQSPRPQQWMLHSIGSGGRRFASVIRLDGTLRVQLDLNGDSAKGWLASLENERTVIERALGDDVIWYDPPNSKRAGIRTEKALSFRDPAQREAAKAWLYEQQVKFHEVLGPHVRALDAVTDEPEPESTA